MTTPSTPNDPLARWHLVLGAIPVLLSLMGAGIAVTTWSTQAARTAADVSSLTTAVHSRFDKLDDKLNSMAVAEAEGRTRLAELERRIMLVETRGLEEPRKR